MSGRRWLLDLDRSVRRVLKRRHGGTGNEHGWAAAVVQPFPNGDDWTLPIGSVVSLRAGTAPDRRVRKAATADGTDVLGVVVGTFLDGDGTFVATDPTQYQMVAVMTQGVCPVLVGAAVTMGEYAHVHSTDGTAYSSASVGPGAFGRFLESAGSGSALASIGVFGGGGGGGGASFGTPALTLGTSNAAGSAGTAIRTDATIALFDGTAPVTQDFGDAPAAGSAGVAARRDHVHGMPASPGGGSFAEPAVVLGTAADEGIAETVIRSDATIVAFDVTVPTTGTFGDAPATGSAAVAARRDHVHGMPSAGDIVDAAPSDKGWFGDGSDGSATFDGSTDHASFSTRSGPVYTLSRDVHLTTCTVDSGVTLDTNGYHLNVRGTLDNDGAICRLANDGTNNAGGGAGAALASRSLGGSSGAGGGAVSSAGTANGNNGATNTTLGFGGAGGAGGASSGGGTGGNGGAAPAIAPQRGSPRHLPWGAMGWVLGTTGSGLFLGGAGGGGGATTGTLGRGGGGGGGGGVVIVKAHRIVNDGVIHADGGAGGNGAVNVGWGGGGGGGGGGVVVLVYTILTGAGMIRAAGGAGGLAPGGAPATDGSPGSAGRVIDLSMS